MFGFLEIIDYCLSHLTLVDFELIILVEIEIKYCTYISTYHRVLEIGMML